MKKFFLLFGFLVIFSGCSVVQEAQKSTITENSSVASFFAPTPNPEPTSDEHYDFVVPFLEKNFYEEAFETARKGEKNFAPINTNTNIAIVNHHLLAPHFVAGTLLAFEKNPPKKIFLLSTNHFSVGKNNIATSNATWKTPFGNIKTTPLLGISTENFLFEKEHGITNILPFVAKIFPEAEVSVIAVKESATQEEIANLKKSVLEFAKNPENLIIGSMDFSHDLTPKMAEFHDSTAISALQNLSVVSKKHIDVDSKHIFSLLVEVAKEKNFQGFQVLYHSNSAQITKNPLQEMPTSYIAGFFTPEKTPNNTITILFTGDIMLDRYMRKTIDAKGIFFVISPFVERFLQGSDIVLGNHEGSVTPFAPHKADPNMTSFTFAPETSKMLKEMGFTILNLGNNHTLDFGKNGFAESEKILTETGFKIFGHPFNVPEKNFVVKEIHGKKLGFIGFHELFEDNFSDVLKQIQMHRKEVDFLFVLPHWGTEYLTSLPKRQQEKARKFIDAGADAVIGTHPHVVQPFEVYNGKYIFYSLGNFIFDQVFSEDVRNGISVGMTIENGKISAEIFPTRMGKNFQLEILMGEEAENMRKKVEEKSIL